MSHEEFPKLQSLNYYLRSLHYSCSNPKYHIASYYYEHPMEIIGVSLSQQYLVAVIYL